MLKRYIVYFYTRNGERLNVKEVVTIAENKLNALRAAAEHLNIEEFDKITVRVYESYLNNFIK